MAVGSGRDVNVIDGPIRENGHGFPPRIEIRNAGNACHGGLLMVTGWG